MTEKTKHTPRIGSNNVWARADNLLNSIRECHEAGIISKESEEAFRETDVSCDMAKLRRALRTGPSARLIEAAPDALRFAEAIRESVDDALRPGSPDTFMSLVGRLKDYRKWAQAFIAKAEGK